MKAGLTWLAGELETRGGEVRLADVIADADEARIKRDVKAHLGDG